MKILKTLKNILIFAYIVLAFGIIGKMDYENELREYEHKQAYQSYISSKYLNN